MGSQDCIICLDAVTLESDCADLTECGHTYHAACVAQWLERDASCPICRALVPTAADVIYKGVTISGSLFTAFPHGLGSTAKSLWLTISVSGRRGSDDDLDPASQPQTTEHLKGSIRIPLPKHDDGTIEDFWQLWYSGTGRHI